MKVGDVVYSVERKDVVDTFERPVYHSAVIERGNIPPSIGVCFPLATPDQEEVDIQFVKYFTLAEARNVFRQRNELK